jgi:hypothetical protein
MRQISDTNQREKRTQVIALIAFLFTLCFSQNMPVLAQGSGSGSGSETSGSGSYSQTPVNSTLPGDTCGSYDKRFPFMGCRRKADQTTTVSGQPPSGSNSTTRLQQSATNTTPQIGVAPAAMLVEPTYLNGFYYQPYIPEIQIPKQAKDTEIFQNLMTTFGLPVSDTQFQMIARENNQRELEIKNDPERMMWSKMAESQLQGASASNSMAGSANQGFSNAVTAVQNGPSMGAGGEGGEGGAGGSSAMGALINIANENAGVPTASDATWKPIAGAVWMVQQMYKFVFIPMAILFLLPGAVLTQVKGQITSGILGQQSPSPFEGILRAMIAVFLIPATQLIMSYAIDVGNSLTYSVNNYVDASVISTWTQQTIYTVPTQNVDNAIIPPPGSQNTPGTGTSQSAMNSADSAVDGFINSSLSSALGSSAGGAAASLVTPELNSILNGILGSIGLGGLSPLSMGFGGDGLGVDTPDSQAIMERQLWLSQTMELILNSAIYLFSIAVLILGAFQLVFMCYLFLMGPLAAALFAWPVLAGASNSAPNSNVFSGWVDAVITCSLWRFFWMVILAIMTQRILWMMDTGQQLNLQWEVTIFICFLGLMLYVPFHPWDYNPGTAFTQAMQAGQQLAQAAGPAAGQAAKAAGMSSSQISQVGNAFNSANSAISHITNNQNAAATAGAGAAGKIGPESGGNSNQGNSNPGNSNPGNSNPVNSNPVNSNPVNRSLSSSNQSPSDPTPPPPVNPQASVATVAPTAPVPTAGPLIQQSSSPSVSGPTTPTESANPNVRNPDTSANSSQKEAAQQTNPSPTIPGTQTSPTPPAPTTPANPANPATPPPPPPASQSPPTDPPK